MILRSLIEKVVIQKVNGDMLGPLPLFEAASQGIDSLHDFISDL